MKSPEWGGALHGSGTNIVFCDTKLPKQWTNSVGNEQQQTTSIWSALNSQRLSDVIYVYVVCITWFDNFVNLNGFKMVHLTEAPRWPKFTFNRPLDSQDLDLFMSLSQGNESLFPWDNNIIITIVTPPQHQAIVFVTRPLKTGFLMTVWYSWDKTNPYWIFSLFSL